jgi:hypothetical protein
VATPVHGAGLLLRRSSAVLGLAFVLLAIAALTLPSLTGGPAAWVLPALALATGSLAVGTWVRVELAVAGFAAAWVAGTATARFLADRHEALADTAPFTAPGQGVAAAAAVLALVVLVKRADRYATLEART